MPYKKFSKLYIEIGLAFIFGISLGQASFAQTFVSDFGISFELSKEWSKYPKEQIQLKNKQKIKQNAEIYYYKSLNKTDFVSNIYITSIAPTFLSKKIDELTSNNIQDYCNQWQNQVASRFKMTDFKKSDFKFNKCQIKKLTQKKHKAIYFAYKLTEKIIQSQYLLVLPQKSVLITASYKNEEKTNIEKDFELLSKSLKLVK